MSCSVDATIFSLILSWIGLYQHLNLTLPSRDRALSSPFYSAHEPRSCTHLYDQIHERRWNKLYTPILIPDAPSASDATNPRLSAMPPEARYGAFSSCAARASCVTLVRRHHGDQHRTTYQDQPRDVLLARVPGACHKQSIRWSPYAQCNSSNTHSNPSMLRISTPIFSADCATLLSLD